MKREISPDEAESTHAISALHEEFERECRFRLRHKDGSAYIRTVTKDVGGWQFSHFHKKVRETYIVQNGWMILAELAEGVLRLQYFGVGGIVTTQPNVHHNVFMGPNSVTHTVKHGIGDESGEDKYASPECDALTRHLDEEAIFARLRSIAK